MRLSLNLPVWGIYLSQICNQRQTDRQTDRKKQRDKDWERLHRLPWTCIFLNWLSWAHNYILTLTGRKLRTPRTSGQATDNAIPLQCIASLAVVGTLRPVHIVLGPWTAPPPVLKVSQRRAVLHWIHTGHRNSSQEKSRTCLLHLKESVGATQELVRTIKVKPT